MKKFRSLLENNLYLAVLLTPLRVIGIIILPFLARYLCHKYHIVFTAYSKILIFFLFVSSFLGLLQGTTLLTNVLLSLWIYIPILILYSSKFVNSCKSLLENLMWLSSWLLLLIDSLGFVTYFYNRNDDEFGVPYGSHFNGVHGLALLNAFVVLYYLSFLIQRKANRQDKFFLFFFLISFIMCFNGLLLVLLSVVLISYILFKVRTKQILMGIAFLSVFFMYIYYVNSDNINYIVSSISIFYNNDDVEKPRKVEMFQKAYRRLKTQDFLSLLFGNGPGSYNGRVAFMLNTESNNVFTDLLGHSMPILHKKDVFELWNEDLYSMPYNDGTINRPHVSLISLIIENGLIFTFVFLCYWIVQIKRGFKLQNKDPLALFYYFSLLFMLLCVCFEQWIESTEFIFFLIIIGLTKPLINNTSFACMELSGVNSRCLPASGACES